MSVSRQLPQSPIGGTPDGQLRCSIMRKIVTRGKATALAERGRRRLMLRMPERRRAIANEFDENFLAICEDYELAWAGLSHWAQSGSDERAERVKEFHDLTVELEREVELRIARS